MGDEFQNLTPALHLRKKFNVSPSNALSSSTLQLDIRYDDGFIAFLNGAEAPEMVMKLKLRIGFLDRTKAEHSQVFILQLNKSSGEVIVNEKDRS